MPRSLVLALLLLGACQNPPRPSVDQVIAGYRAREAAANIWTTTCQENRATTAVTCGTSKRAVQPGASGSLTIAYMRLRGGHQVGPVLLVSPSWDVDLTRPVIRVGQGRPVDLPAGDTRFAYLLVQLMRTEQVVFVQTGSWPRCSACIVFEVSIEGLDWALADLAAKAATFGIDVAAIDARAEAATRRAARRP